MFDYVLAWKSTKIANQALYVYCVVNTVLLIAIRNITSLCIARSNLIYKTITKIIQITELIFIMTKMVSVVKYSRWRQIWLPIKSIII